MPSTYRILITAVAMLVAGGAPAGSQVIKETPAKKVDWSRPTRFDVGIDATYAQAANDFGRYVDHGWGADFTGNFRLDRRGILGLRADILLMEYGSETKRVPFLPYTGRVLLEVRTANSVVAGSIGPELRVPGGPIRPFVNAAIAAARFSTRSSIGGSSDETSSYASTENYDDATAAYRLGVGVYVPIARNRWNGGVTLSASFYGGGRASYLREGSITDNANGTISFDPIRSRTEFWAYNLGVQMNIPRSVSK